VLGGETSKPITTKTTYTLKCLDLQRTIKTKHTSKAYDLDVASVYEFAAYPRVRRPTVATGYAAGAGCFRQSQPLVGFPRITLGARSAV
jgi:hypothetical protein